MPLIAGRQCIGVMSAVHGTAGYFSEDDEDAAVLLAAIAAPHVEIARLSRLSSVDNLTGVLNRKALGTSIPDQAGDEPLTVVLCNIDSFARVNDEHGRAIGDLVLKQLAERLRAMLRGGDVVLRYGDDEFMLLLPRVGLATGTQIAERARKAVQLPEFSVGGAIIKVTLSLGVAGRQPGESRDDLVSRVDKAVRTAKQAGGNRVAMAR